jgi:hypothetical protein
MRKAIITTIVTGLIGFGAIAAPMAAFADGSPGGTSTTLGVTGGDLTITTQDTADVGLVAAGQTSTSGQLGNVTVSDMRAAEGGEWSASVVSSDFTTDVGGPGEVIAASAITYTPGSSVSHSGDATFTVGDAATMSNDTPVTAYSASDEVGVASITWDPTVDFALPSNVVAGTYTGTITHSVA